jgi:hypothetical protein
MTDQDFLDAPQTASVPITLDEKQIRATVDRTGLPESTIREVIDGINDVLTGDPVGTVRRSPDGRIIAVRVNSLYSPYRTCVPAGSASWRSGVEHTWPIVYRPEND